MGNLTMDIGHVPAGSCDLLFVTRGGGKLALVSTLCHRRAVPHAYLDVGRQSGDPQLEADLVVALPGGAVADERSLVVDGRLDNAWRDGAGVSRRGPRVGSVDDRV